MRQWALSPGLIGFRCRGLTTEADEALATLREVLELPHLPTSVLLQPGDVLVLDNRRVLHSRSAFTVHYDGRDRHV